jgi:uncharacterized protein (UPF0261 family)
MNRTSAIVVLGTFDSKAEEHLFLRQGIEARGRRVITINVGTKGQPGFEPDYDLRPVQGLERDTAMREVIQRGCELVRGLYEKGEIGGLISAGGGTGTYLGTSIMKVLPLGVPKVMVSTVASRNMGAVVGTKDITMMHSVGDLLGVNSISGRILDSAAGAVCGMAGSTWRPPPGRKRIALTMFGFITRTAEAVKKHLENLGHEVIAFHANGTGGLAMEQLAGEGFFDGILDLATHEFADSLKPGGYCSLIGPGRLEPTAGRTVPRLVVPGGLDCIVLEFTRDTVPSEYRDRRIFYYDFRSAVSLNLPESISLGALLAEKISRNGSPIKILVPWGGWSEAAGDQGPLFIPENGAALINELKRGLSDGLEVLEVEQHILDPEFAEIAARTMDRMLQ